MLEKLKKIYYILKYPHIIVVRIVILIFVCLGLFGFANNLQQQDTKNKIDHDLNELKISKENQEQWTINQKKSYLQFHNQNKIKTITYHDLLKKINHGELISVSFVLFPYIYNINSDYIVDMYQDRTQDYLNDKNLYDEQLDADKVKSFTNKKIIYNHNKIIQIQPLEVKNGRE